MVNIEDVILVVFIVAVVAFWVGHIRGCSCGCIRYGKKVS